MDNLYTLEVVALSLQVTQYRWTRSDMFLAIMFSISIRKVSCCTLVSQTVNQDKVIVGHKFICMSAKFRQFSFGSIYLKVSLFYFRGFLW